MKLIESITANADELQAIRRDIHAHPELGYDVFRTAALVAARLEQWGFAVTPNVAAPTVSVPLVKLKL